MITEKLFTEIISNLRDQYDYDISQAKLLGEALDVEDMSTYNNSLLVSGLFNVLEFYFEDKLQLIKEFCYDYNFGRDSGDSIKDLWFEMNGEYAIYYSNGDTTVEDLDVNYITIKQSIRYE